jgi:pimeloyl-ACP methyl ester carboxylesterase
MRYSRIWLVLGLISLRLAPVLAQDHAPAFEETACPFVLPETAVTCGYLTVEEDRSAPNGRLISLAVAILHAHTESPAPDPVVYLAGGPGGAALFDAASWLDMTFLEHRDLILVDQRGTGFSHPTLDCLSLQGMSETPQGCRNRLVRQGITLSAYNSAASAADLDELRQALGYEQWNLLGISYGTRLALTAMRDFPNNIRSVILDSTYPPEINSYTEQSQHKLRAFHTLFAGCAAHSACSAAYPDLENVFFELVELLNDSPVVLTVDDSGTGYAYTLSGDDLFDSVFQALYATDRIPYLPYVIYEVYQGNYAVVSDLDSGALSEQTLRQDGRAAINSEGMFNSVECYEEMPFNDREATFAAIEVAPAALYDSFVKDADLMYGLCAIWDVGAAGPIETRPVVSDIPALILAGEYDPVTPPVWGQMAAQNLSDSTYYEFPGVGHSVIDAGDCPRSMVTAFLDNPAAAPDAACLASITGPDFVVP